MPRRKRNKKVKRYRRSFYSRGMKVKKALGILLLAAVVLGAAWLAAPHVLDWATHTWYTVVRDRDLPASSDAVGAGEADGAVPAGENYIPGVYVKFGNLARFCRIDPVSDEHPLVTDGAYIIVPPRGTAGSVSEVRLYDQVIVEGQNLYDGKLLS